jgi:hypothetical protein
MYFTVYKTTNLVNGKIYIGVHKTNNPFDDYLGSGTAINNSIIKYGRDNFEKDILAICDTEEEMYEIEKRLVNQTFLKFVSTYNMIIGGKGGFPNTPYSVVKRSKTLKKKYKEDEIYRTIHQENLKKIGIKAWSSEARSKRLNTFKERGISKGEKNPNFGTCWINNGTENKKMSINSSVPEGWVKGRKAFWKARRGKAKEIREQNQIA